MKTQELETEELDTLCGFIENLAMTLGQYKPDELDKIKIAEALEYVRKLKS